MSEMTKDEALELLDEIEQRLGRAERILKQMEQASDEPAPSAEPETLGRRFSLAWAEGPNMKESFFKVWSPTVGFMKLPLEHLAAKLRKGD